MELCHGAPSAVRPPNEQAVYDFLDKCRIPFTRVDHPPVHTMEDCLAADVFISGANALSLDGQMVNIDGHGNRVSAIVYGPKEVLIIAGMNKVEDTLDAAIKRARTVAAPMNQQRFGHPNPCGATGVCGDCKSETCICNQILITRHCRPIGRIKFILACTFKTTAYYYCFCLFCKLFIIFAIRFDCKNPMEFAACIIQQFADTVTVIRTKIYKAFMICRTNDMVPDIILRINDIHQIIRIAADLEIQNIGVDTA